MIRKEIINHHTQALHTLQELFGDNPIVGVEIGTAGGGLTKTLLYHMPKLKLYTIDPYIRTEGSEYGMLLAQEQVDRSEVEADIVLKRFGFRVVAIKKKSDDAVKDIKEKVEFVWIDGNHDGDQVERDIDNYIPLVKKGGLLGGHDYGYATDATDIIDAKFGDKLQLGIDAVWWVYL